jgi:hypothetical protein
MLLAMVSAFGLALLAIQVAQANDMRTRGQTAADAAAIASLTPLRDAALNMALNGGQPDIVGLWMVEPDISVSNPIYARKAREYARRNGATLIGKPRPSGARGYTMKVSVATRDCILKRESELTQKDREDLRARRNLCTDNRGRTGIGKGRGSGTAIAELRLPTCNYVGSVPTPGDLDPTEGAPARLVCEDDDGVEKVVWYASGADVDREAVLRMFKIRLVAHEDPEPYTGIPPSGLPSGPYVQGECLKDGPKPDNSVPFGERIVLWAKCWLGTPYSWGGGGPNGPSFGICCSPGGHDARRTFGFDCSGLTEYAVYQASRGRIVIGSTTYVQINYGVRLNSASQLRPGDLIFPNPGHVAIYAGGGMMIEAPQTGDVVKISPIAGRGFYAGVHVPPPPGDR